MSISIIIPTFNEAQRIQKLVNYLLENSTDDLLEIIVSDAAQSSDNTVAILQNIPKVQVFRAEANFKSPTDEPGCSFSPGRNFVFRSCRCLASHKLSKRYKQSFEARE